MKNGKKETPEGIEQTHQEKIRNQREKTDTYFGILEADTIKKRGMKRKNKKRVSQNEKTSRNQSLLQGSHHKIFYINLKLDKGGIQTNGAKDKKINDYSPGLTLER